MIDYIADIVVINVNIHTRISKHPKAVSFAVKNGRFILVGNNSDTQWRSYGDNSLKIIPNNTFEIGTDQYVIEIEPDVLVDINDAVS